MKNVFLIAAFLFLTYLLLSMLGVFGAKSYEENKAIALAYAPETESEDDRLQVQVINEAIRKFRAQPDAGGRFAKIEIVSPRYVRMVSLTKTSWRGPVNGESLCNFLILKDGTADHSRSFEEQAVKHPLGPVFVQITSRNGREIYNEGFCPGPGPGYWKPDEEVPTFEAVQ